MLFLRAMLFFLRDCWELEPHSEMKKTIFFKRFTNESNVVFNVLKYLRISVLKIFINSLMQSKWQESLIVPIHK